MNHQLNSRDTPIRLPLDFDRIAKVFDTELADIALQAEISGYGSDRIRWIQQSLNKILGLRLAVDGVIGTQTRSAIRTFQKQRGLVVDGVVGANTEKALRNAFGQTPGASTASGYLPSSTRLRFEYSVAIGDWREAFLTLNGLNMHEMLRALDNLSHGNRSQLLSQRENFLRLVNMPRIDYAIKVVQTRQLPTVAPGDLAATGQVQTATDFLQAQSTDWTRIPANERMVYVMRRLIQNYGFPANGAAGLVGNLWAESGLIPNRIEGSSTSTPMKALDFNRRIINFTVDQIMNRNKPQGPKLPGVGLAQWTTPSRRTGLFRYSYRGRQLGAAILFHMDAQIDYLVNELSNKYRQVYNLLMNSNVVLEAACDEVVYSFETPGAILAPPDPISGRRRRLPRNDHRVQEVFRRRRKFARQALSLYRGGP